MLDNFKNLKGFSDFTAPSGTHAARRELLDKVSLTITKNAHSSYHSVMFNFGVEILSKIDATRGDRLEISVSDDGKSVAFRKGPKGWMLTGTKKTAGSASQFLVSIAEHYFGKTYTKKLGKRQADHAVFGDCIIVDISQLDRLAG